MANNSSIFTGALNGATGGIHERWITATLPVDYTAVRNAVVEFASVVDSMIAPDVTLGTGAGLLMQAITQGVLAQRYIVITDDFTEVARAIVALWESVRTQQLPFDPAYPPPGGGLLRVPVGGGLAAPVNGTGNGNLWYYDANAGLWVPTAAAPADNQIARWNAALNRYDFVEYTSAGDLQYFDLEAETTALYAFNNSLNDLSPNGINLTATGNAVGFSYVYPGKVGVCLGSGSGLQSALGTAAALTGDCTVELIFQQTDDPASTVMLMQYAGVGETQAANALWGMGFQTMNVSNAGSRRMAWVTEHGAGIDDSYISAGSTVIGWIHNVQYCAVTRIGNVIQPYYMGLPMGPPSAPLTTPDGGTSARLLFGSSSGTACIPGVYFSGRVTNVGKTPTQIKASYNRTMGPAFGRLS